MYANKLGGHGRRANAPRLSLNYRLPNANANVTLTQTNVTGTKTKEFLYLFVNPVLIKSKFLLFVFKYTRKRRVREWLSHILFILILTHIQIDEQEK
jgi:hypothetical protein